MSRRGFICAGCWTVDRIKLVDQWPNEEQLALIAQVDRQGGGSAHNVGIDLRRMDSSMPVLAIGLVGADDDGDFLFDQASAHGLDISQLHRTEQRSTSYTDVMSVSTTGKRTFFHYPGTNDLLLPEHFDFSDTNMRILHLGLLSLHAALDATDGSGGNGWSDILCRAQAAGLKTSIEMVSIDAVRNRELALPCLPYIDYLILNDHEIGGIADVQTLRNGSTDVSECVRAAQVVLQMGAMQLVAVHFPGGAVCVTQQGEIVVTDSLNVPQAMIGSSVGAGDAFAAGLLYGIHEQWPLAESLQLGHVIAAASLRAMTTVGSVESIARCRDFAQSLADGNLPTR